MSGTVQRFLAVVALAALLAAVPGGCTCVMPSAPASAHACCEGDGGAVIVAANGCCAPDVTPSPGVTGSAMTAGAAPVAVLPPARLAACARTTLSAAAVQITSATPLILRI